MALNSSQIETAKKQLEGIESFHFEEAITASFPDSDLSLVRIGPWSVVEFVTLSKRMAKQLHSELDGPYPNVLPHCFWWDVQGQAMEQRHLDSELDRFLEYLRLGNWKTAAYVLEILIGYQIHCGFWDRGERKLHSISRLKQNELFESLRLKSEQLTRLISEVSGKDAEFGEALDAKRSDATKVSKLLQDAENNVEEIGNLLNQASTKQGRLEQLLGNQDANFESSKAELKAITELKAALDAAIKAANAHLNDCQDRLTFMEGKAAVVNEIAGTAGAGLLGGKFEARRKQLQVSSWIWFGIIILSVVASALWVGYAHQHFDVKNDNIWKMLAANFGLLLPAIFLLGYVARQYAKERHYLEEYAFRSAVAMTLSAFADLLKDGFDQRNKLYAETVEKMYQLPVLLREKQPSPGWFRKHSAQEAAKTLLELVKELNDLKRPEP
jgi:hypothetical protein